VVRSAISARSDDKNPRFQRTIRITCATTAFFMPRTPARARAVRALVLLAAETKISIRVVGIALMCALGLAGVGAKDQDVPGAGAFSKRMADGKEWTTANLNVSTSPSWCYDDADVNCRRYGRLYTWDSARRGCESLGGGWRLPTDDEWRQLATHYGGIGNDSPDKGRAAYAALSGGPSGFNAVLGGNRSVAGQYERLEAHGFYWTASESDPATAPFYNFGKGSQGLYRQPAGGKQMAVSVRCIRA
jgi:uncharacterized protein (TIGR02145 family)